LNVVSFCLALFNTLWTLELIRCTQTWKLTFVRKIGQFFCDEPLSSSVIVLCIMKFSSSNRICIPNFVYTHKCFFMLYSSLKIGKKKILSKTQSPTQLKSSITKIRWLRWFTLLLTRVEMMTDKNGKDCCSLYTCCSRNWNMLYPNRHKHDVEQSFLDHLLTFTEW